MELGTMVRVVSGPSKGLRGVIESQERNPINNLLYFTIKQVPSRFQVRIHVQENQTKEVENV